MPTESQRANAALSEQEGLLRALFDATTDFVYMKDLSGRYVAMNVAGAQSLGMTPEQIVGKRDDEIFPPGVSDRCVKEDRKVVATGRSLSVEQTMTINGAELRLHTMKSPWRNEFGDVVGVVGISRDVTERRQAEEKLREAQSRFQKLFASDLMGIHMPDRYGAIFEANDEFLRIVGYTRADLEAGKVRWDTMTPPEYKAKDLDHIAEAASRGACTPYEKEYIRKDGTRVTIMCGFTLLTGSEDQYIAFIQDLTALKSGEEALRQAEKLNTASRFAASMAHEINNPLASVTNLIYLALHDYQMRADTRELLETADLELSRISGVVAQTLRFHKQLTAPILADIGEVMDSVFPLFSSRLNIDVSIEREYLAKERIWCFNDDLRHAFANLVGNSLDSIPHDGRIRVRVRIGHRWVKSRERGIVVVVADTGHGISEEMRKRLFEPFFTTKEATGTGLGLWATENIVRKHRGRIACRTSSKPGRSGTVFSMFLPFDGVRPNTLTC